MEAKGHVPDIALLIHVDEAFIHCGKALKRGRLWDPEAQIDRAGFPKMGEVMYDHGRYADKYPYSRQQIADMAQDDYDNYTYRD